MKKVTVTYNGHACFTLESDGYRTVLDPYADGMVPGVPALCLEAEAVLCSHSHGDHAYVQAVSLKESHSPAPYTLETVETPHDDKGGTLRGMNLVHIFDFDGFRVAHLGDLGEVPSGQTLEKLRGVHCLLIPVGGFFTIGPEEAEQTIALIDPVVAVPMHYRTDSTGFDVLSHLSAFTDRYENVHHCDNSITLTKDAEKQILVINYKP